MKPHIYIHCKHCELADAEVSIWWSGLSLAFSSDITCVGWGAAEEPIRH